jgi:hypothetical protein
MTGRAAGYCAGYPVPGFMNPFGGRGFGGGGWGRGFGRGRGRGWDRGWGFGAYGYPAWGGGFGTGAVPAPVPTPATASGVELDTLKAQAEYFENSLGEIKKRIEELESQQQESGT